MMFSRLTFLFLLVLFSGATWAQTRTISKSVVVPDNTLEVTLEILENQDCISGNGSIEIAVTGGSGTYTYSWTGPGGFTSTDEDVSNLLPGIYNVTVSDPTASCSETKSYEIGYYCPYECSGVTLAITSSSDPSSCSSNNGSITLHITGGTAPYAYEVLQYIGYYKPLISGSSATTDFTIPNLPSGTFEVSILTTSGASSCYAYENITLGTVLSLSSDYVTGTNTSCSAPNGVLSFNPVNYTALANLTYDWANLYTGDTYTTASPTLTGLPPGYYSIAVNDSGNGCAAYGNGQITNTNGLALSISTITNTAPTTCSPGNGVLEVGITGGTGNYSIAWFKSGDPLFFAATKKVTDLSSGSYSLYASDAQSGCSANLNIDLVYGGPIVEVIGSLASDNTSCAEPYNGSISLELKSPEPPNLKFEWLDNNNTVIGSGRSISGLAGGNYGYRITNLDNGCIEEVAVGNPLEILIEDQALPLLGISIEEVGNSNCSGTFTGAIDLQISNLPLNYTLEWRNDKDVVISTSEDPGQLVHGNYNLTVVIECEANSPPIIDNPVPPTLANNQISLNMLQFISDPDGNLNYGSFAVTGPTASGAIVSITLIDGVPFINFDYTGISFSGTEEFTLIACDTEGACTTQTLSFPVAVSGDIVVYNALSINGDDQNAYFRIENIEAQPNTVKIFNRWGDEVFSTKNYDNSTNRFEGIGKSGKALPPGSYFYVIQLEGAPELNGYLLLKQ